MLLINLSSAGYYWHPPTTDTKDQWNCNDVHDKHSNLTGKKWGRGQILYMRDGWKKDAH